MNNIIIDNIKIEVMTQDDLKTIKNILTSDFDEFWNYNIFKEELQSENSKYLVAKFNNEIIGFAGIKIIIDESDIMNIVTKKAFRNQGVGTLLLNEIIRIFVHKFNETYFYIIFCFQTFQFERINSSTKFKFYFFRS